MWRCGDMVKWCYGERVVLVAEILVSPRQYLYGIVAASIITLFTVSKTIC